MWGTFHWLSVYIYNMFRECQEWAQGLTFKQKMDWSRFATFDANPQTTGHSVFTTDPYGKNTNQYFTLFTLFMEDFFSHKGICIICIDRSWFHLPWAVWIKCSLKAKLGQFEYVWTPQILTNPILCERQGRN